MTTLDRTPRVAIADDAALFREGLRLLLEAADVEVVHQARDGTELLSLVDDDVPDVVILDIRMAPHPEGGLDTAEKLRERYPRIGILMLSQYAEAPYLMRLLKRLGSRGLGYRLKDQVADVETLRSALLRIMAGETVVEPELVDRLAAEGPHELDRLSTRELEVLRSMAEGHSNEGIAAELHLTTKTVENNIARIFTKLDLPADTTQNRRVIAVLRYFRALDR
ncbi:response regulator transcription factor [Cryptosporangium aurantiacum]|uniref:DNA-binding response regulator, NarL/FixJ family, contains REC and HTH domains n=1 Tax=Cryptosporangium aurantiacum TaxID=134849 RepID=A0A1M7REJ9_9ACTN|nr:response regulator transcription factor [Cryptosporangium aurantiacum]SHN44448.1 DNA-binding response regulator, NarL/FixJ family, contains REC and HTH domains [Cryptosporangium aurantiacum]